MALHDNTNFVPFSVTLSASGSAQLVPPNALRWYLAIENTGTGRMCYRFDRLPTSATDGVCLDPATTAGGQGGSWEYIFNAVPANGVYVYSQSGTTVTAIEGR